MFTIVFSVQWLKSPAVWTTWPCHIKDSFHKDNKILNKTVTDCLNGLNHPGLLSGNSSRDRLQNL